MDVLGRPVIGVGLMIIKGNQILLGKRKGSHGAGEYGGIGGHMEHGETFEECALRELREECGPDFKVKNVRFLCVTNVRDYPPKHFVDVGFVCDWESGEPVVTEPDKLEGWRWYGLDALPAPLFCADPNYIIALKNGQTYFPKVAESR
jgi:8-oxo-dGTP diphosphatase